MPTREAPPPPPWSRRGLVHRSMIHGTLVTGRWHFLPLPPPTAPAIQPSRALPRRPFLRRPAEAHRIEAVEHADQLHPLPGEFPEGGAGEDVPVAERRRGPPARWGNSCVSCIYA